MANLRTSGVFNLGGGGADGEGVLWTPSDLTDTPYVWVDGDQGLTNQGDGGSITVTTGWTDTSTQNGLGTVGNTTNSGRFTWPESTSINTTFALVKGDSGWTTRAQATMYSGTNYEHLGGSTTGVIGSGFTTVETWRHTRENGTQINWVSGDWGTKTTDWELYAFQSSASDPWRIDQFGTDRSNLRHFSGYLAEALVFEEELSLDDIEKIEGYLMHRWGLSANLPSGHTYKSAAPTSVAGPTRPTRRWGGMTGRSITPTGDSYWNDVVLLLDGSSTTDVTGTSTVTPSASGYTTNNTTGAKFNQYIDFQNSGYFNVSFPSALGVSDEPFTAECWTYLDATSDDGIFELYHSGSVLDGTTVGSNSIAFYANTGVFKAYAYGSLSSNVAPASTGQWYHLAVVYDGTDLNYYVDGTSGYSVAKTMPAGGWTNMGVGGYYTTTYVMDGRIEGLRVTKGVARYTADFTPPTEAFPTVAGGGGSLQTTGVLTLAEHYQSKL